MSINVINTAEMEEILGRIVGSRLIGLTTSTETQMKKTGNPFYGKVHSVRNWRAAANQKYAENVEKRRIAEGKDPKDWKRGSSWMIRETDEQGRLTPFCRHKDNGTRYLFLMNFSKGPVKYIAQEEIVAAAGTFQVGDAIDHALIHPHLKSRSDYANQGLADPVKATTFKLSSIVGLRCDGQSYIVRHARPYAQQVAEVFADLIDGSTVADLYAE